MKATKSFAVGALALLVGVPLQTAIAQHTTVATIYGMYDTDGFSSLPLNVQTDPLTAGRFMSGGTNYDTPALFFVNPSDYALTGVQMFLSVNSLVNSGQNTLNDGVSQTVNLADINPHSITQLNWGTGGSLFSYDYDDEYSSNNGAPLVGNSGSDVADCTLNFAGGHPEWHNFCAPTGNFLVKLSGTLVGPGAFNGLFVAAVFSEYDVNGHYTGWEGLDPNGWSENLLYDVHSGTVSGVLANIDLGTVDDVPTSPLTATPEPATLALMGTGLLGLVPVVRRRRKMSAESK